MSIKTDVAKTIVGEVIHDSYGRVYGRILGFSAGSPRSVPLIWVEQRTGEVSSCPSSQITLDNEMMIVNTSWTAKASRLSEELRVILQKLSALHKLYNTGEIVKEPYDKIRNHYETTIHSLTQRRQLLSQNAEERLEELAATTDHLELLLAKSKLEHSLGYIDEDACSLIVDTLRDSLKRTLTEKNEAEATIDALAEVSMPPETSASPRVNSENASSQPIVLRIKEAGL
jgi:hypothetical protein